MYDEVVKLSTSLLEDENRAMADAFAGSLGELAASSHSPASQSAVSNPAGDINSQPYSLSLLACLHLQGTVKVF